MMTLRRVKKLEGLTVQATDGKLGRIRDMLFDDEQWMVRYVVVDTHPAWPGGNIPVATSALQEPDWLNGILPVNLERQQVKDAPDIAFDAPMSRQAEALLHRHFSWIPYWGTADVHMGIPPTGSMDPTIEAQSFPAEEMNADAQEKAVHVRRINRMRGSKVSAGEEQLGVVSDHIMDDDWRIRYIEIDTRLWLPGKHILIIPDWIDSVDWESQALKIDHDPEMVKESPEYDPSQPITPEYEQELASYYKGTSRNAVA